MALMVVFSFLLAGLAFALSLAALIPGVMRLRQGFQLSQILNLGTLCWSIGLVLMLAQMFLNGQTWPTQFGEPVYAAGQLLTTIALLLIIFENSAKANLRRAAWTLALGTAGAAVISGWLIQSGWLASNLPTSTLFAPVLITLAAASFLLLVFTPQFWLDTTQRLLFFAVGGMFLAVFVSAIPVYPELAASSILLLVAGLLSMISLRPVKEPDPAQQLLDTAAHLGKGAVILNPQGNVIDFNRPAARLLRGQTGGNLVVRPASFLQSEALIKAIAEISPPPTDVAELPRWIQQLIEQTGSAVNADRAYILRMDETSGGQATLSLIAEWTQTGVPGRLGDPHLNQVPFKFSSFALYEKSLSKGKPISAQFQPGEVDSEDTLIPASCQALLLIPIRTGEHWWGILGMEKYQPGSVWSPLELQILENGVQLLGLGINSTRLEAELSSSLSGEQRAKADELAVIQEKLEQERAKRGIVEKQADKRLHQLQALNEATNALVSTLDLETLLGRILDAVTRAIPSAEKGILHMIAQDTGQLEMRAMLGFSDPRIRKHHTHNSEGLLNQAVQERRPLLLNESGVDEKPLFLNGTSDQDEVQSIIIAPLIADEDVYGALSLASSQAKAFDDTDLLLLTGFADTATLALRNAQLHTAVQKMAITDALTNLYNRRGFEEFGERLFESAIRFQHPLTVIAMDIDDFKEVNDTFGHSAGDLVLQYFSDILLKNIRKVDLVGRMGGDEFTILLPETDINQALQVAERLRLMTEESEFQVGDGRVKLTVSLGITRLDSENKTLKSLLDQADRALYEAKNSGRNRICYFPEKLEVVEYRASQKD